MVGAQVGAGGGWCEEVVAIDGLGGVDRVFLNGLHLLASLFLRHRTLSEGFVNVFFDRLGFVLFG